MVRIQTGSLKGRVLRTPKGPEIRPTSAYIRELVFNLIGPSNIVDANFLDLCAGTGAMGFEAISRGAARAFMVDNNRLHCNLLHENAKKFGVDQQTKVICQKFQIIGKQLLRDPKLVKFFDYVYIDPPYTSHLPQDILASVQYLVDIVDDDGVVFVESGVRIPKEQLPIEQDGFICVDERHTATSQLTKWIVKPEVQDQDITIEQV